ncbi:class I glutamine amidotransferase-like protein [Dactylonectria estremocensis]|uniref:Class I glutamine amidotransferase-like protein n=1 Tax=Dactylonectria estremocensis TaxID=1079267 RepID=A0A9P9DPR5_9HYPO|nr:class I glutamine amidotransferase-like protein [Dactylonectria estremocensis]
MASIFRLAILETDETPVSIAETQGSYGEIVERLVRRGFAQAEGSVPELHITKWDVVKAQSYPSLGEIDGIFLTAGKYAAYDEYPWASKLIGFLKQSYIGHIPILAICYGHQILARALGGTVIKNPKGCELSVTRIDLTPSGIDLFETDHLNLHQMHLDTVVDLPSGMQTLGSSAISEVQFMYEAGRVLGVQGHPEANGFIIKDNLDSRFEKNLIEVEEYEAALSKINLEHDGDVFAKAIPKFLLDAVPKERVACVG